MKVIITGMHRSGTSLTAALLGLCGLNIGSNFRKPLPDNPKGFFEDLDFKAINKNLILYNTGKRGSLFVPEDELREHPETERMIRAFLNKWAGPDPAGWKDPRASLTVHIWRRYIPDLKVVVCLRPHIEIAQSLRTRNGISIFDGVVLSKAYLSTLNKHIANNRMPAHFVNYHDLMKDWRACLPELCRFLNIRGPRPKDEHKINDFIEPDLWHERQGT